MANKAKTFLVSTADFAFKVNGVLACTGTTNLNTSLEVSMQEQNINGGKGNKLVYSFKYGRELGVTLEAADWKLEFIAANVGRPITQGLNDVYHIAECVTLTNGIGMVADTPISDVAVELEDGSIVTVKPTGKTIDLSTYGITNGVVNATYQYNRMTKRLVIDADSTPMVGELVLDADKHNNKLGKVGSVQITVPSYQLSGNFSINFTPDGVTSTNLDGKALAVEGDTCADGSGVYAYIDEFDNMEGALSVADIAATPAVLTMAVDEKQELSVIGLKGSMYSPIQIENTDCEFVTGDAGVATVEGGIVTAVAAGTAIITVTYEGHKDVVEVTVA